MTTLDAPTEEDEAFPAPVDEPRSGRRRRPAPRASWFWRFVFPVLVVAAGVAVFFMWREGTKAVLDSTDGRVTDLVVDPAEPGYEVFVDPTPTLLLLHVDAAELVGVTAMARTDLDDGGSLTVLTRDLLVPAGATEDGTPVLLRQAYAEGGVERVQSIVERLFGFGFLEARELDTEGLGAIMSLVEPLTISLPGDLLADDGEGGVTVWLEGGLSDVSGATAAEVYAFLSPGEADANRVQRQLDLWRSWLAAIGDADDLVAATTPFEEGIAPYLRSLGTGTRSIADPPVTSLLFDPTAQPVPTLGDGGKQWMLDRGLDMVPLPISSAAAPRVSVRLLDGTGDPAARDRAIPLVVEAGAAVPVIGNASSFDVATTTVAHHRAETAGAAEALAAELGATVVFDEDEAQPVDLTITIGLDREAG